jgi:hypothetical protein
MADITVDVILPNAVSVDVTSPTQSLAANVLIPGPQGPRGEDGLGTLINGISGNLFFTGADGIKILATGNNIVVVSGNSGYFQNLINQLFLQTQIISGSLEVLGSGFFLSGVKIGTGTVFIEPNRILINGDHVITRSGLNDVSGYFESENTIGYSYSLPVGNDNYFITYPSVLNSNPRSVNCIFQNPVDDIIYYFSLGEINKTGFNVNFSDNLTNNGYFLNINVKK